MRRLPILIGLLVLAGFVLLNSIFTVDERQKAIDAGLDLDAVLTTDDLVSSNDVFFVATGITDGELMQGVRYKAGGATTHSLVMRSRSGTIRNIISEHKLQKLKSYAAVDFEH